MSQIGQRPTAQLIIPTMGTVRTFTAASVASASSEGTIMAEHSSCTAIRSTIRFITPIFHRPFRFHTERSRFQTAG